VAVKYTPLGCIFQVRDTGARPATTCDTEVPTLTMTIGLSQAARAVPMVLAAALLVPAAASAASSVDEYGSAAVSPAALAVAANVIDFESDTAGSKADPFTSASNPTVHFQDTLGDNLDVANAGSETNGQGLRVFSDDASALVIRLDVPTKRISVTFGNDDPGFSQAGDQATLKVYRFGKLVATENVEMNRNDAADQVIQYRGGAPIDRARFVYSRGGAAIDLIEVVDDIKLAQICQVRGNNKPNKLVGSDKNNGICGFGGADRLLGRQGNDVLDGGKGNDRLNGGPGNDLIKGGVGDDIVRTADGVSGNDTVYGGPGNDVCIVDPGDTVFSCETVVNPS